MPRGLAKLLAVCLTATLVVVPQAKPQDGGLADGIPTHYWPHRTVGIPVNIAEINKSPVKPTDLQLFYAFNRGQWQRGTKLSINALDNLNSGKKGFLFKADNDGEYEFALQFINPDGSVSPRRRGVFHLLGASSSIPSRPMSASMPPPTECAWVAKPTDENLDPNGIATGMPPGQGSNWQIVNDRALPHHG